MPIHFELTEIIRQPIARVFVFLSDFSNMPLWNYYIQSVTKISQGDVAEGAVFEMKRPHDLNRYKITELTPPQKITVELQPPGPKLNLIFELSGSDQQTLVTYTWQLHLEKYKAFKYLPEGGFKRLLLSIPKKIILSKTKPAVEQNFKKLKELLENGQVTLQDGRLSSLTNQ